MKKLHYIFVLISVILAFGCSDLHSQAGKQKTLVLKGATVYDGNGERSENVVIVVSEGKIKRIDENGSIPKNARVIDVSGKFITPGLVDSHVHYFQTGFFDSRPDALDLRKALPYIEVQEYQRNNPGRYHEAYLRSGVTAVYDVGGFPWSIDLQKSAESDLDAPHVAASGSLITPAPARLIQIFNVPTGDVMVHLASATLGRKVVAENSRMGSTGIKIWGMRPNDPVFMENMAAVADEVRKQNNKLIVHATSLDQAKAALRLNAKLLVHSVRDREVDEEFIQLMLKNRAVYNPTLVVADGYVMARKLVLGEILKIQDPHGVVDKKTRKLLERASSFQDLVDLERLKATNARSEAGSKNRKKITFANLVKLYKAGVLIAVGTDAGNPGTLPGISIYDELERMQLAGIEAEDLIVMATKNGAIAMDRIDDFGTLETGKMADLIILDKDPGKDISNMRSITHVMRGGKLRLVSERFGKEE